jgi:hypothetical protein
MFVNALTPGAAEDVVLGPRDRVDLTRWAPGHEISRAKVS